MEIETVITNYAKELSQILKESWISKRRHPCCYECSSSIYIEYLESRLISLEEELFKLNQDNQSV